MNKKKILMIGGILIVLAGLAAFCYFRFARTSYTVSLTVGEHGSVSGIRGDFVMDYSPSPDDNPVVIIPDDGYMTDRIIIDGEVNEEYTEAAHLTQYYMIEDLKITKDTSIEVSFKELDDPALAGTSNVGYRIKATSEGPGDIVTVYEDNAGFYLSDDEEEDRTITWISDTDNDALVKSVTINGVEDPSYAGKDYGEYVATEGDVDIHVVFEKSSTPLPENADDYEERYKVTTSAGPGGEITDSFEYYPDEDNVEEEVIIYADIGYYIDTVKINGEYKTRADDVGIGEEQGVYTFYEGDQTVEATFTTVAATESAAGKITAEPDKQELHKNDEVNIELVFEPENTRIASNYYIDISDFEFISSDKGSLEGTVVSGTIDPGTEQEHVNLTLKYFDGTIDGTVTAKLFNDSKTAVLEPTIFLYSEADMTIPDNDNEILDHSDIIDEEAIADDPEYEESASQSTTIICVLGIAAVVGLAAIFIISRRRR